MNNPLVSIVFTSYNHQEYLLQAVESILQQSYKDFELIIVDDCSTDNSQDILRRYEQHPQVQLHLLEKNTGSYVRASNYGARFAKGQYLLFAQCDDYSDPTQVSELVRVLEENPGVGVAFSKSQLVDGEGNILTDDFQGREHAFREKCVTDTLILKKEMRRFLYYACVIPNLSAAMIRRELYTPPCTLSEKYIMAADWAMWLNLSQKTDFYYIAKPLNYFRQHGTTIRSQTKLKVQVEEIFALFYDFAKENNLSFLEKFKLRTFVGSIWFWYYLDSPKAWKESFFPLVKSTFRFEKLNVPFLCGGGMLYVREYFRRKLQAN